MMLEPKKGLQTTTIHAGEDENPSKGLSSPIYQSATYRFDNTSGIAEAMAAEAHPKFYGRYGSPNTKQVEATVALLEGGEAALAVASGMAAIQPNSRLIYVETPANPTLTLTDLRSIAAIAKEHGLFSIADNTFATPYNQKPLSFGFHIVIHSATKYLSGHSDVIAGVIVGDKDTIQFLEHLELISLAVSLGGTHSLITHPASTVSSIQTEQAMIASGLQPGLVRFSVGS
jgi:methionine-gamma-lyase